jgi:hypothetical protein
MTWRAGIIAGVLLALAILSGAWRGSICSRMTHPSFLPFR